MGYTHYHQQLKVPTDAQWQEITDDAIQIIDQATSVYCIQLASEYDQHTPPIVSDRLIRLNGVLSNGHETFFLERETSEPGRVGSKYRFRFCKTACKPYDAVVGAILLSMHRHAPGCWDLASDGDWSDQEWKRAYSLYKEATGVEMNCPEWLEVHRNWDAP